jgi:hypothetical protein
MHEAFERPSTCGHALHPPHQWSHFAAPPPAVALCTCGSCACGPRSAVRRKAWAEAVEHYDAALALSPLNPDAWFALAYAHMKLGPGHEMLALAVGVGGGGGWLLQCWQ